MLPYATKYDLVDLKNELLKKIMENDGTGDVVVPTKVSELENDLGFITDSALTDYALKSELPNTDEFVKEEDLPDFATFALKTEVPVGGVNYFALTDISDADHSNRHSMMMKNDDSVSGYALKDNQAYNLVMVNKWDVADFGSRGLPINLNGSKERPTYNDDKEIALVEDLPDTSNLASKEDVDNLIKPVGAAIQIGNEDHEININTNNRVMINSTYEVATFEPYAGEEGRKLLVLSNNDCLTGKKVDGTGVPLVFMSKWDKVEVGGSGAPLNLNGSADRVTYKDDKEFAFVDDLEWIPVICNMNFRTLADKVYTQDEIFAWFFVKDIFELKNTIIKHPIYLRYGISLSTNPMYYYIPCQYVAFTDANTLEMITDGLDTRNDKFSRYHITIKLDGTVINGASNIKVELKENVIVPELPEDADSKTYQLKAVNGVLTWVE